MITIDDEAYLQAKRTAAHILGMMNPSTAGTYEKTVRRLMKPGASTSQNSKSTLRVQRAALRWYKLQILAKCKDRPKLLWVCDKLGWDAGQIIRSVQNNKWTYSDIPHLPNTTPPTRLPRNTKRKLLPLLPSNWRPQFIDGIQSTIPAMRTAFFLMAITGCRPAEIQTISWAQSDCGLLTVRIASAKRRSHQKGDFREMRLPLPTGYLHNQDILNQSHASPLHKITPKQISDVARKVSKRVFPSLGEQVTASTFRHQFCSDLKAHGCTRREIALAMGHSMIESQNGYGRPRYGCEEHVRIEVYGSFEPSEPNSHRSRTFLDIKSGHDLPEP